MESSGEDGGARFREVEVSAAEGLGRSDILHIVKEVLGFVLYMHQQIPSVIHHLENEFSALKEEHKNLEETCLTPNDSKAADRRKHTFRKREVKQGIRRLEKLMHSLSTLLSALQLALDEMPDIQEVALVLGASLLRPQHVYQLVFSGVTFHFGKAKECTKSKVADGISRKAIRALISAGAGSSSYMGPCKLFLLVKSSSTFSLPLHFLPKRDFHFCKKIVPLNLHIKCKFPVHIIDRSHQTSLAATASSSSSLDSTGNDVIWFQCKHTIKGLACKAPTQC
ncbi:hypothetical protein Cni_G21049 [Canna indica]|uniref:Uncharacterized protein n=1 Tax=Canna indica TaxID=4628 RepID=A0AAQ3QJZ5_9LILI|nr:hypothetical protein Cni_G21049 [Canna indica]